MAYSSILKPSLYMNTKLYTGDGAASHAITGVGFQPDWVWLKNRSGADNNSLNDVVRGANKNLVSNNANSEATTTDQLMSFNSDGFTVGASGSANTNGNNFVGWNWKAGTAVSGSTTGSGTAKTYTGSVNTTSGFSIIKYTGNGTAGHTIPHHLGAAPQMIIVKALSTNDDWMVGHTAAGFNQFMILNSTARDATGTQFNSTVPTSSVFSIGSNNNMNQNDNSFVAYSFTNIKGFSKFGGYTGNGNADGTFVYTGFKPAFVMVKLVSAAGEDWFICDNKREGYNAENNRLLPNLNSAESTDSPIDILSNGFKARTSGANVNAGEDYLYMAFAENPFVATSGTSALPVTAR
mgnify:CR=1 FL=1